MRKLEELEKAVEALPRKQYGRFRQWFMERDWEKWDSQIEADSKAGKLDSLVKEALEAKAKGELRSL